jgi:hypothetical protein
MEISVIALCVLMSVAAQTESLEKKAMSIAQSPPAPDLNSAPEHSKEEEKSPSPPAATAEPQKASAEHQKIPRSLGRFRKAYCKGASSRGVCRSTRSCPEI